MSKGTEIKPNLNNAYVLAVTAAGSVMIFGPGDPRLDALPVHSCHSRKMAESIRVMVCSLSLDGSSFLLPRNLFDPRLPEVKRLDQLPGVGEAFATVGLRVIAAEASDAKA